MPEEEEIGDEVPARQKVAVLMISLGQETTAEVMKYLTDIEIEQIAQSIAELDVDKRKVVLSIKLLEEIEKKEALEKYGSEGSGKNLPFSSLSEDLKKKDKVK